MRKNIIYWKKTKTIETIITDPTLKKKSINNFFLEQD